MCLKNRVDRRKCFTLDVKTRPTFNELKNSWIQICSVDTTNLAETKEIREEVKELVRKVKENEVDSLDITIENLFIEECQAITNELKYNEKVRFLTIQPETISLECITCVIQSLNTNTSICWLTIYGHRNNYSSIPISVQSTENDSHYLTPQAAYHLSEFLKLTTTLTTIDFSGKEYANDQWAVVVANVMKVNQSITDISMNDGQVGDARAQVFGEMLVVNKRLKHLPLIGNHITEHGAKLLANGLKRNTTLQYLFVGNNQFTYDSDGNKELLQTRREGLIITHNCS